MILKILRLPAIFLLLFSANVSATTITFEEELAALPDGFAIGGFEFENLAWSIKVVGETGSRFLAIENSPGSGGAVRISTLSGEAFSLESVSLLYDGIYSDYAYLTGYYEGGGTVVSGAAAGLTTNFDSDWKGLDSVVVEGAGTIFYLGIDTIVVSTIPIPAAAWLFGSALVGLGWMRRKQTV